MSEEELARIAGLAERATPGPWRHYSDMPADDVRVCREGAVAQASDGLGCVCCLALMGDGYDYATERWPDSVLAQWRADAEFVAASREAIPALLAEIGRLQDVLSAQPRMPLFNRATYEELGTGEW